MKNTSVAVISGGTGTATTTAAYFDLVGFLGEYALAIGASCTILTLFVYIVNTLYLIFSGKRRDAKRDSKATELLLKELINKLDNKGK